MRTHKTYAIRSALLSIAVNALFLAAIDYQVSWRLWPWDYVLR